MPLVPRPLPPWQQPLTRTDGTATLEFYSWARDVDAGQRGGTVTVAQLPAASSVKAGTRGFVSDANATTFASIVAGGGANTVPVYSDGMNWRIG